MNNTTIFHNENHSNEIKKPLSSAMRIALMSTNGRLLTLWVPAASDGCFYFHDTVNKKNVSFVTIQAVDGAWYAICNEGAFFQEIVKDESGIEVEINCGTERPLFSRSISHIKTDDDVYTIYPEIETNESNVFHSYTISKNQTITIGRLDTNDICIDKQYEFVSRRHAKFTWKEDGLHIENWKGRNGVFLNNIAIQDEKVSVGDKIFMMGLRIVIGAGFIAINDGNQRIRSYSSKVCRITPAACKRTGYLLFPLERTTDSHLFNRTPRKRIALQKNKITIEAPPMAMSGNGLPMLLRMGSSMVMGGSAALTGNYTMLLTSVLFPFLSQKYTSDEKEKYEALRKEKYLEYLDRKKDEIEIEKQKEQSILRSNYPEISKVLSFPLNNRQHLWERRNIDDDFLLLRLGSGQRPLFAQLDYPEQRFNLVQDELETQMYNIAEEKYSLENVPVLINPIKYPVIGIAGNKQQTTRLLQIIISQVALLHSYDEVKIVFLHEEHEQENFEFVRYLPHIWDDERNIRFLASSPSEAGIIGEYLNSIVSEQSSENSSLANLLKSRPYYFIITDSKRLFDSLEVLKDILRADENCGFSVIAAMDELPKECLLQIELSETGNGIVTYLRDVEEEDIPFILDNCSTNLFYQSMHVLANTNLKLLSAAYALPKSYTFLEMFGVGRVEHLNVEKRWKDNNPVFSLATPIGIATDGSIFTLDLHQKYQGPHGLVAGMTGSGKSEFLITYILSLAVNYHPDEVAFVLIDFKGGGLAGAFDDPDSGIHLPHVIATITNLDVADVAKIQRSLMSLNSEIERRQKELNNARSLSDEGTIDIYMYQRMYRNGVVKKPMPHLFIICDEFAELKQKQPEFMDQLISIARIGRSLGIHLILATQKPAGVVNEQIRSNTKFRVCLKVQDRADSMDMLERPEAAGLRETGRFYLQVGYNEQFALGQSAWSGATYQPQDTVLVQKDESVQFIDSAGQSILTIKPTQKNNAAKGSQLVEIVRSLTKIAAEQGIQPQSLWRPELPKTLDIDCTELERKTQSDGHVTARIGMIDDPQNQVQFPLDIDFNTAGNLLLVGNAGSGKTTLLHTIIRQLVRDYSPDQFQFYALDYSSRMLATYNNLPHCGGVLLEEDNDSLPHFFKIIQKLSAERKKVFSSLKLDSFDAVRISHKLPLILVVIDNYSGLVSSKEGEKISYNLAQYMKDSLKYGIKYIITESHINGVPSKIRLEAGNRLALHMKDKYEYGDALNGKVEYCPPELPGRGLCMHNGRCLEFQTAIFASNLAESEKTNELLQECKRVQEKYANSSSAIRLPVMNMTAEFKDFCLQFKPGRLALGFSMADNRPIALPLKQFSSLSVYFGKSASRLPAIENLLTAFIREKAKIIVFKRSKDSIFGIERLNGDGTELIRNINIQEITEKTVSALWQSLDDEVKPRREMHREYCAKHGLEAADAANDKASSAELREKTNPLVILFESYVEFCEKTDPISRMVYWELFSRMSQLNMYLVCCFEPDDMPKQTRNQLLNGFNEEGPCLLFGGKFKHQSICQIPESVDGEAEFQFNFFLMRYDGNIYPLRMPCGVTEEEQVDEDDKNIFV